MPEGFALPGERNKQVAKETAAIEQAELSERLSPMTAPKPTTGSVEERAKIAAKAHHDEYRRKNLNVAINEWSFHLGYLNAAQAEGARRAVEILERLTRHATRPPESAGPWVIQLAWVDEEVARLRAELSAGGTEKGGEG
jgi:hypothetical protein